MQRYLLWPLMAVLAASPHRAMNKPRTLVLRYGVAVLIVIAAAVLCLSNLEFARGTPFLLFYPVPLLAPLYGGLGPGLLAAALSGLAVDYMLLPPYYSFGFQQSDFIRVMIFVGIQAALCRLLYSWNNQLRQSEARFRSLYEHAAVGIEQVATDGRLLMVNPALCHMLGYSETELLSKRFVDITHPDDRERQAALLEAMLRGDRDSFEIEKRYLHRDGSPVWVSVTSSLVRSGDGHPLYRISIIQDVGERKRAEAEARRSQQTFAELIERAPFGIYVVDSQFRIAQMNTGSQNGAFRNVRPVIGRDLSEAMRILWPEPVAAEIIAVFRHTLETGEPYYSPPFIKPRHDVAVVESYEWELHRMALPDGQYGVICYYFDSTTLRAAEEAARESEERLRQAADLVGLLPYSWEPLTGALHWDSRLKALWGLPPDAVTNHDVFLAGVHPEDRAYVAERIARSLDPTADGNYDAEYRVNGADGVQRWVSARGQTRFADGTPVVHLGVALDITKRKRAEEALRTGEERLAAVIDNAMDAIITVDEKQRVVLFNAAAEKTFGCSAAEALGKPLDRFLPERFRTAHAGHIQTFGLTGTAARSMHFLKTLYGQRASGEEFPLEATISQARIGGQKLYTVILRDISHKKQAEELARLYAQSQELDQLKTEFFANISHELRTPLALILGPIRKRLAAGGMNEEERQDLERVDRNAGLLLRRVNDLLDLSKLDAGRMTAEYTATDLAVLGRLVASSFDSLASERGIHYLIDIPSALSAQLDHRKIERVLINLLSNAFRFTPVGGSVRFAIHQENDRAVVEVEDTGPGVPPNLREAIFERFRQVESGANQRLGGTGLGLSIARQFVSLHGGGITVSEASNASGALFRVDLPLLAPAGTQVLPAQEYDPEASRQAVEEFALRDVARSRSAGTREQSAPLVLIIEDNPDMSAFLSDRLSAHYRTDPAFDGQE
ncbi:MAG TPA: PAS domain S-box protein, partial [Bryobacteraceae bacterium]|nr:PAS domain S-box protein [Bryobacteraceae bacterium]